LTEAARAGAANGVITFSVYRLLWNGKAIDALDPTAVAAYHSLIAHAADLNLGIIGTSTTWIFPPGAQPTLVPPDPDAESLEVPERRIACVPGLDTEEYVRLRGLRARMWATYVREFSEVDTWIIGFEPDFPFYACDGRQLSLDQVVRFAADALGDLKGSISAENAGATVIGHFLGVSGIPLRVNGQLVQPKQIVEGLADEIRRRGHQTSDYFDQLASALDPTLLDDRYPELPLNLESTCYTCSKDYCTSTAPWSCAGWNVKCCEEFQVASSDVVRDYWEWDEWLTSAQPVSPSASGGWAQIRLQPGSLGGAVSHPQLDIVPDIEFDSEVLERNRWTAVQDFRRAGIPEPGSAHAGAFIRMHDRPNWQPPNPTRFGCIVYPTGEGKLQFTGDDLAEPGQGKSQLFSFTVSPNPFASPDLARVQIIEREWLHPLRGLWEPWWMAEVHQNGKRIGYRDWVGSWTLENVYGIGVPDLTGSKLGWGLTGDANGIDVERTGTAYWVY
jgi:hypothetical protein